MYVCLLYTETKQATNTNSRVMEVVSVGQIMIFSGNEEACPLSYLLFSYSSSNLAKEYSTSCSKGDYFLPLWHSAALAPNESKCETPNHDSHRQAEQCHSVDAT